VEAAWLGSFFSSNDGGRGAGKSSGCGKLFAFAEFSGELDHDDHGKFLLGWRGTEFAARSAASWASLASTRLRRTVFP
jgi:hypothetical protein